MKEEISQLKKNALLSIRNVSDESDLEVLRVSFLGKKGSISNKMRSLGEMSNEEKSEIGPILNDLKNELNKAISEKKAELRKDFINERLRAEWIDITQPPRERKNGSIHPVSQVTEEVIAIFSSLGFSVAEGPQIESDWYNFDALNIPREHPARQEFDTFYIDGNEDNNEAENVLRTHTSPVQIRYMECNQMPCKIIAPGRVYRSDYDQTHTPMFHQVEGLAIDKDITMANLKWILEEFCKVFFELESVDLRFRSSHFPFTEPSAEVDIKCSWANGKLKVGEGNDWLEILGSGMVHPKVLEAAGVNANEYQGFAFGMGIDRIAMLKYGIPDLRSFFDSDLRWLKHYGFRAIDIPSIHSGISNTSIKEK